jgi:hypothetical protein
MIFFNNILEGGRLAYPAFQLAALLTVRHFYILSTIDRIFT